MLLLNQARVAAEVLAEELAPVSGVASQGLLGVEAHVDEEGGGELDGDDGQLLLLLTELLPLADCHELGVTLDQLFHQGEVLGAELVPGEHGYETQKGQVTKSQMECR